ncbi:hypothetical protein [Acidicapsa ligni]|uniref:hypothetical protein n=1 Tax=Acidicapsa ligni TaxID=542300 RepID=UPI0021E00714|nr:hypothetical protein [Acidicapsa ligni]
MPGLTEWLKRKFRSVALELTRHTPEPETPARRRTERARSGFMPTAKKIMRRVPKLPAPVYAATSFLSHTLDWMNPWHDFNSFHDDMDDDLQPIDQDHIYPHL